MVGSDVEPVHTLSATVVVRGLINRYDCRQVSTATLLYSIAIVFNLVIVKYESDLRQYLSIYNQYLKVDTNCELIHPCRYCGIDDTLGQECLFRIVRMAR
jgi:hypothetical protein